MIKGDYWIQGKNATLSIDLNNINSYTLSINNETWLIGGAPNLWCNNHWYSPLNTNGYILKEKSSTPVQTNGNDQNLGSWVGVQMTYTLTSNDNICNGKTFVTEFQYFNDDDFLFYLLSLDVF